ncbi:MAG: phosphatase PAP2 family protein [Bacteroidaceae bacterium]|jgi:undecaprenyl-diphosphatase|nr:phosphatase PAP2 family protein [Bacteroidaceae bacterium]
MDLSTLEQIDRELLLALNGSHSLFADTLMMTFTSAWTWVPLYIALLYVIIKNNENMQQILLILCSVALCIFLADGISSGLIKPLVGRFRPTQDPIIKYQVDVVNGYRGGMYGFFSSHAANTFSICIFLCMVIRNKILTLGLLSWSLINCWTRIYLGVHYPGDILCGLVWGFVVGMSVYLLYRFLYKRISTDMNFVSSQYTSTGYALLDIDIILSVLMLTYMYALLRATIFI